MGLAKGLVDRNRNLRPHRSQTRKSFPDPVTRVGLHAAVVRCTAINSLRKREMDLVREFRFNVFKFCDESW